MTAIFGWLGEMMQWIISWIPRVGICRQGHAGVRFRHGHDATAIEPGLYVYWPLVTEVQEYPVARQTLNLTIQRLVTKDDRTVVASAVVVYRVRDVLKAIVDSWDIEATISDIALTATVSVVTSREYAALRDGIDAAVKDDLTKKCQKALSPFGIEVLYASFTDFCPARVISLANDTGVTRHTGVPS